MGLRGSDGHGHGRAPGDVAQEAGHALAHARAVVCLAASFFHVVRVFIEAVPGVYSLKVSVNMDASATVQKGRGAHMGVRRLGPLPTPVP